MNEERKYAILFATTILAARKLNDPESTPWAIECAITDAIQKAEHILDKIDERWPTAASSQAARNREQEPCDKAKAGLCYSY